MFGKPGEYEDVYISPPSATWSRVGQEKKVILVAPLPAPPRQIVCLMGQTHSWHGRVPVDLVPDPQVSGTYGPACSQILGDNCGMSEKA